MSTLAELIKQASVDVDDTETSPSEVISEKVAEEESVVNNDDLFIEKIANLTEDSSLEDFAAGLEKLADYIENGSFVKEDDVEDNIMLKVAESVVILKTIQEELEKNEHS